MVQFDLSKRKHLPIIKYAGTDWPLWAYFKLRKVMKTGLNLDAYGVSIMLAEMKLFEDYYLPPFSLKGKTVLDIGACCGETAWFYLKHGAEKVVCIEPLVSRLNIIQANQKKLNLNIEVVGDIFRPDHLNIQHDFLKCDIEGYEMELIPYIERLGPSILEVHTGWIKDKFEKVGFHCVHEINPLSWIMSNY